MTERTRPPRLLTMRSQAATLTKRRAVDLCRVATCLCPLL
jgi:hypothetical protein